MVVITATIGAGALALILGLFSKARIFVMLGLFILGFAFIGPSAFDNPIIIFVGVLVMILWLIGGKK